MFQPSRCSAARAVDVGLIVLVCGVAVVCATSNGSGDRTVEFAWVTHGEGLVGGFAATSESTYVDRTGLVQVSRQDTSGVLGSLREGPGDPSRVFELIGSRAPPAAGGTAGVGGGPVADFQPPRTLLAYSGRSAAGPLHGYAGEVLPSGLTQEIAQAVLATASAARLEGAAPGLYARAEPLTTELGLIKFDLELEPAGVAGLPLLDLLLTRSRALIRVPDAGEPVLGRGVALRAGAPLHVRVGRRAYLVFPYRLGPASDARARPANR